MALGGDSANISPAGEKRPIMFKESVSSSRGGTKSTHPLIPPVSRSVRASLLFRAKSWKMSLGARIALRLGMILGLASLVLFGVLYNLQVKQMRAQVHTQAQALLTNMLTVREWVASYGGVWTERPGNIYMEERGGFYRKSPAMVTKELSELAADKGLYFFHITSLHLKNPANAPDDFERIALRRFEQDPTPIQRVEYVNGQRMYRLMVPLRTTTACLECHLDQGYHVGDIRGGLSVMVPMAEADRALSQNRLMLILSALSIMLLVMGGMYVQMRHTVISPIKRLTAVAEAITHGNYHVECHVDTGDELETLANAFNDMIGSIVRYQNALQSQVERRTRELEAIANIALVASEAKSLDVLLQDALKHARNVVGVEGGLICLYSNGGKEFFALWDVSPAVRRCLSNGEMRERLLKLIDVSEGVLSIPDLREKHSRSEPVRLLVQCFLEQGGYRSMLAVPLRSRRHTLGFMLLFHSQKEHFSDETVQFLTSVANQLGVAVQNAHYHEQVAQLAVLEERQRIARELHDSVAQTLGWLGLKLEMLADDMDHHVPSHLRNDVMTMQQVVREAVYDVRESILALRQDPRQRLVPAVGAWIADFRRRTGLDVEFRVTDKDIPIPPIVEVEVFRIMQEALTNVRKHAHASHVRVEFHIQRDGIDLTVKDDGRGFVPEALHASDRFGLRIMRERAESLGGSFEIFSRPGQGTLIHVHLPLTGARVL